MNQYIEPENKHHNEYMYVCIYVCMFVQPKTNTYGLKPNTTKSIYMYVCIYACMCSLKPNTTKRVYIYVCIYVQPKTKHHKLFIMYVSKLSLVL